VGAGDVARVLLLRLERRERIEYSRDAQWIGREMMLGSWSRISDDKADAAARVFYCGFFPF